MNAPEEILVVFPMSSILTLPLLLVMVILVLANQQVSVTPSNVGSAIVVTVADLAILRKVTMAALVDALVEVAQPVFATLSNVANVIVEALAAFPILLITKEADLIANGEIAEMATVNLALIPALSSKRANALMEMPADFPTRLLLRTKLC